MQNLLCIAEIAAEVERITGRPCEQQRVRFFLRRFPTAHEIPGRLFYHRSVVPHMARRIEALDEARAAFEDGLKYELV